MNQPQKPKLYHIVAISRNGVIGKDNQLPWHFSADMRHFKETTTGNTIIMGRRTFESIGRRPLPNRENFVLSRSDLQVPEGVRAFKTLGAAVEQAARPKIFIIGGAELYKQTINEVDGIYLTRVLADYDGDAYYPEIPGFFKEKNKKTAEEKDTGLEFIYLENS